VTTYCDEGTQGFFCTRKVRLNAGAGKTQAFLVFRGTEPGDFRDIRSDISAALKKVELNGEVLEFHSGYFNAFESVRSKIEETLKHSGSDQLFITGHSLGGALAIVTTRILASDSCGACYTFGAPPVGTVEIQNKLKTPVYEIINEIDIVPRLPNPWAVWFILLGFRLFRILGKSVTLINQLLANGNWDARFETFIESMTKYRHPGYLSYLVGDGRNARLRFNVDGYDRLKWWTRMICKRTFSGFGEMLADHSIDAYVSKLTAHARSRQ
jgi:triacylglycerol lipase